MKKAFFYLSLAPLSLFGQNLVPNPGFEEYKQLPCACMQYDIEDYVMDWNSAAQGTPDVIYDYSSIQSDCYASSNSSSNVSFGMEKPHGGHGHGMVMTTAHNDSYREYLGVTLKTPLEKGQKYYAEFWTSLGDRCHIASNNMGMAFFTGSFERSSQTIITTTPVINQATLITTADGWVKISGTFVAADDYDYLVIGNFLPTDKLITATRTAAPGGYSYSDDIAAYYIDDIVVKPISGSISVKGDTLVAAGTTVTLTAMGCKTYSWADASAPSIVIGKQDQLKMTMTTDKTFIVTGENGTAQITVRVFKKNQDELLKQIDGRTIKKGKEIEVNDDQVTITLYDKDEVDGDSVTIYYGDSCIVSGLALTHNKKSYKVQLDKEHSKQLILYAVNVGAKPPNTAAILIKAGDQDINIVLSSDLTSCDAVILTYKPK
ncbi:MAG TPA: hypothetical protein VL651_00925 [Bacteroidia bacterium]|jgi:hypothetical protein|nr:hypothetical protein [Bacteroidia bacterium]